MQHIFNDSYQLPEYVKRVDSSGNAKRSSNEPYDDLFVWSLLLYSGEEADMRLMRYFWSKTKHPIGKLFTYLKKFSIKKMKNRFLYY